jgi:Xaa-Pro aminopeptidase
MVVIILHGPLKHCSHYVTLYTTSCKQIRSDGHFALYVPDPDSWREAWDGARLSTDAAIDFFGADEAYATSELPQRLNATLASAPMIAMDIDRSESSAPSTPAAAQLTALRSADSQGRVQPLKPLVHQLRWSKSAAELGLMRQSAAAATSAMMECMRASHPGVSEHFLASLFEWRCKAAGAQRMAYPPVVAGGADGVTIHYSRNDKQLGKEDLLLLDGGCEYFGYCSDVTRTWPIGGKFTSPQLAVYEAVLATHQQLIAACRPGTTMRQLHQLSVRLLAEALRTLGVLRNVSVESIVANQSYRTFYPHSVGHLLGMDVHDANTNSHDRPLEPGVVLTIEPGLYIPDDPIFGALRGIGVRLEDDVAVTRGGPEVLSEMAPLDPAEVEDLVGEAVEEGRGGLAGAWKIP